jgi:quinol monooxygenase YgiN
MVTRIVKMTFKPELVADFLALFHASKSEIRNAPGCMHLELLQCTDASHVFFTYSHWRDTESLDLYRRSEVFAYVWPRTKALFAAPAEAWSTFNLDVFSTSPSTNT